MPEETFVAILGLLEWNDQQLDGLYNYVYQNGLQQARCGGDDSSVSNKYLNQLNFYLLHFRIPPLNTHQSFVVPMRLPTSVLVVHPPRVVTGHV